MIARTEDGGDFTYYVYQGEHRYAKLTDADGLATTTTAPIVAERYLYGPGTDQILAVEDTSAGEVYWALADHQGSVRDVVYYDSGTETTVLAHHREFDAFGRLTYPSSPDSFEFAYTGRPLDATTDLYNYRARWYDASVGRFLSEDPTSFDAGDMNLYRYVGNNPMVYVDPSGMKSSQRFQGFADVNAPKMDTLASQGQRFLSDGRLGSPGSLGQTSYGANTDQYALRPASPRVESQSDGGWLSSIGDMVSSAAGAVWDGIVRADQFAGQLNAVVWTQTWVSPETTSGVGVARDFGYEAGSSFSDGRAFDSLSGGGAGWADAGVGFLESVTQTVVQDPYFEYGWRPSDYASPVFGNTDAFSDAMPVGQLTLRAQALAATAYTGGQGLQALSQMSFSLPGFSLAASGGELGIVGATIAVPGSAVAVGAAGTATIGGYIYGQPMLDWATDTSYFKVVLNSAVTKSAGRSGKQARLKQLADDPNVSSADRGWIKQEMNQIQRGTRKNVRVPPGKNLAHRRGFEAKKGYS